MSDLEIDLLERLVVALGSDDAFERRDAIERLALLTHQRLDYRWNGDDSERGQALTRWRRWLKREKKRRRGRKTQKTIQIFADGKVDKKSVEEALKGLPPGQKKAILANILAKVTVASLGGQPACAECSRRPATAQVTTLQPDGTYRQRKVCEVCATREL